MKKFKVMIITVTVVIMLFALSVTAFGADKYTSGVFTYTVTDGEATITGCDSNVEGHLVIPETLGGCPVTKIEEGALDDPDITDITIPKTVKTICILAFNEAVENIHVESIEHWISINFDRSSYSVKHPFNFAENLYLGEKMVTDLVIPEGATAIPESAFYGCQSIRSVTIPASAVNLGECSFFCPNLEDVYVESIEAWIRTCKSTPRLANHVWHPMYKAKNFYVGGELLVDLVIPESVTEIPNTVFYNIDSIKTVTFHSGLKKMYYGAFVNCGGAKDVYVPDFETWLLVSRISPLFKVENLYINNEKVVDLVIPENVTSLPDYAFYNNDTIKSVTFTDNLKSIGESCFENCDALENVYVDSIEAWLDIEFEGAKANPMVSAENLYFGGVRATEITVPEGVTSINDYAFANFGFASKVNLPSTLKSIGRDAFVNCTNLSGVNIPSVQVWLGIDFVNSYANPLLLAKNLYINDELLEDLIIPENITAIKDMTFYGCESLKSLTVNEGLTSIGARAFEDSGVSAVYVDKIEDWLDITFGYEFCNPMAEGATLYVNGEVVTEVVVPESVKVIKQYAFQNCKTLTKVTTPSSAVIQDYAFYHSSLEEAVIGSITEKAEPTIVIGKDTFRYCTSLKKITFGYGVKEISNGAFKNKKVLKEVVFYNSIERIGVEAFYSTGLETVSLPSSLKTLSKSAFSSNDYLLSVTLGDNAADKATMEIADEAFYYCAELESVTIGSGVKSVGKDVFLKSEKLNHVHIDDLPGYLAIEFAEIYNDYSNPVQMADFLYIDGEIATDVVIPEGVTSICKNAFAKCLTLESVKLPSTLVEIGDSAFEGCFYLKDVDFPESLKIIGDSAFYACNSLTKLELGKNVSKIGVSGFGACSNIKIIYMYPEQLSIRRLAFWDCDKIEVVLYTGTEEAWLKLLDESKRETGLENIAVFYRYRPESMLAPESFTANPTSNSVTLSWTKINGVTGYRVYVKKDNGWKSLKTTSKNTYTATQLQTGTKYTFAVKAYINTGALVLWSPNYSVADTATQTSKPSAVTAAQNSSTIKLTWTKCSGATGYRIYFKSGNLWKIAVNATTANSHTFTGLKPGAKFTFAIRPYIINGSSVVWSPYTEFTTATMPSSVTAKASSPSKGSLNLSWNAVNGADGYRVYYKVGNGSYKLYKTYSSVQNLTFKNLKSGTKYTFAVRAGIRTSGGNIYGGYNTATVTVK